MDDICAMRGKKGGEELEAGLASDEQAFSKTDPG